MTVTSAGGPPRVRRAPRPPRPHSADRSKSAPLRAATCDSGIEPRPASAPRPRHLASARAGSPSAAGQTLGRVVGWRVVRRPQPQRDRLVRPCRTASARYRAADPSSSGPSRSEPDDRRLVAIRGVLEEVDAVRRVHPDCTDGGLAVRHERPRQLLGPEILRAREWRRRRADGRAGSASADRSPARPARSGCSDRSECRASWSLLRLK